MNEKIDFSQRLRDAMQRAGYAASPSVLEHEFNLRWYGRSISNQAAWSWLNSRSLPTQDKLQVLAEWLRIEPQILRFGEEAVRAVRSSRQRWEEVAYAERATLDAFLRLPIEQRRVVQQVIEAFGLAYGDKNPSER